jgi:hypothetical protein
MLHTVSETACFYFLPVVLSVEVCRHLYMFALCTLWKMLGKESWKEVGEYGIRFTYGFEGRFGLER